MAEDRRVGLRTLGSLIPRITAPLGKRRTLAHNLALVWSSIVGPELVGQCLPDRVVGGPRRGAADTGAGAPRAATLRVRATGPAAIVLQHREQEILDRINAYCGYRAVERLAYVQGPLPVRPPAAEPPPLPADRARDVTRQVAAVRSPELRAALERLGRAVARRPRPPES